MKDKSDYARKGIARGRSVLTLTYADGILFVGENPSNALHKISEIYDRIAFAAVGKYNEFENLRLAGVRYADLRGYQYDRRDVTSRGPRQRVRPDARHDLHRVRQAVRGRDRRRRGRAERAGDDQLYRLTYDGSVAEEHGHVVMGGNSEPLAALLRARAPRPTCRSSRPLRLGVEALGQTGPATARRARIAADDLEAAVLDRTRPRRAFSRLVGPRLERLLGHGRPPPTRRHEPPRPARPPPPLTSSERLPPARSPRLAGCGGGDDRRPRQRDPDAAAPAPRPSAPRDLPDQGRRRSRRPAGATTDLADKPVDRAGARRRRRPSCSTPTSSRATATRPRPATRSTVKYVGAIYETGKEFDSSWSRGPEETLPVHASAAPGVVPGFAVGPTGMKVGGRRQITIPAEFGYGAAGLARRPSRRRHARLRRRPGGGRPRPRGRTRGMPKTTKPGRRSRTSCPSTLQRSDDTAQATCAKTTTPPSRRYGEGERAHRTAFAAVKHSLREGRRPLGAQGRAGPERRAGRAAPPRPARRGRRDTAGGVDANASKKHLYELAQRLDVAGPLDDEQGRARRGARQGQPARDRPGPLLSARLPTCRGTAPGLRPPSPGRPLRSARWRGRTP